MVNDYFNFTTPLSPHTLGRETAINDLFTAVAAGFSLIPSTSAFTNNLNGYYVDNSVAANAILLTPNPILGAYTEGAMVRWKQKIANTGACTLNISSLGPINLKRNDGSALIAGDIPIDSMPVAIIGAAGAIAYLVSSSAIDVTSAASSAAAAAASATSASTSASSAATSLAACNALFAITATPQFAKLGLGMVPVLIFDITQTQNAISLANILNANGGNSAGAGWSASNNGGHSVVLRMHGTAVTTAGLTIQNGGLIRASAGATGGLAIDSGGGNLIIGVANSEVARFVSLGLWINNAAGGTANFVVQGTGANTVVSIVNNATTGMFFSGPANLLPSGGENGANAMFYVRKDGTTSRSINAAGTINASGADYAEYEPKAPRCGSISKGSIIGFDAAGRITDKWSDVASRFGVKSTDPSYVGGDTWGSEEVLGAATGTKGFAAKLEMARQAVDRISYAGKCPCNVMGASVGDYIVAIDDGFGGITGKPAIAPDFDEYRRAVGRVVALLPDGRCNVAVMVH